MIARTSRPIPVPSRMMGYTRPPDPVMVRRPWLESPVSTALHLSRGRWYATPHLELISRKVAELRRLPIRLIITCPPRHGKSEICSHWTPVWFLANFPDKRVILSSYEATFATTWGRKVRNTIEENSDALGIRMAADSSAAGDWNIESHAGGMMTTGVGGPMTGRGSDLLLIDDPVKNQDEARSETFREKHWQWWLSTARTRLEPGASAILIMTRWNEDDLAGRMVAADLVQGEDADGWELINLPALAERDDPLGRSEGEALWPERFNVDYLNKTKITSGPYWFGAMYQGHPTPQEGGIIKLAWIRTHSVLPPANYKVQFWDTAFKKGQENDYSVCVTMVSHELGYSVVDVHRERVEFPELLRMTSALAAKHHPDRIAIEDAASGQSLVQMIKAATKLPIVARQVEGDKVARVNSITGYLEAGLMSVPSDQPWVYDFLYELGSFPNGAHDDQVDAFVGALKELLNLEARSGGSESIDTIGPAIAPALNNLGLDPDDPKYADKDEQE